MTKILVQPDLLHSLGNQFSQTANELEQIGNMLQSALQNLAWETHHAVEMTEQFHVVQQHLQQVLQYLHQSSSKLDHTATAFAQADGQSTSFMNAGGAAHSGWAPNPVGTANNFPASHTHQVVSTFTQSHSAGTVSNPSFAAGLLSGLAGIGGMITQGVTNAIHGAQTAMGNINNFVEHTNWSDIGKGATSIIGGISETSAGLAAFTASGLLEGISAGTATPVSIVGGISGAAMMGDGLSKVFGGGQEIFHSGDASEQKTGESGWGGLMNMAGGVLENFLTHPKGKK